MMKNIVTRGTVALVTYSGMTYGYEKRTVWDIDGKLYIKYGGKRCPVSVIPDATEKDGYRLEATI